MWLYHPDRNRIFSPCLPCRFATPLHWPFVGPNSKTIADFQSLPTLSLRDPATLANSGVALRAALLQRRPWRPPKSGVLDRQALAQSRKKAGLRNSPAFTFRQATCRSLRPVRPSHRSPESGSPWLSPVHRRGLKLRSGRNRWPDSNHHCR